MRSSVVQVPVSLLVDPDLTAAAKVLWMGIRLTGTPGAPTSLAADAGLTPATARRRLVQLVEAGWYSPATGLVDRAPASQVAVPASLLSDSRLRPQSKVLYGLLQATPGFREKSGEVTHTALSLLTGVAPVTVRQAIRQLAATGWIQARQANQLAPIQFTLRVPDVDRRVSEAGQLLRRLKQRKYRGEEIMKEYLSLLIDSTDFEDNARPGFLVNPLTKERMELDRYYKPVMAFEFHGPQHFHTTELYPDETDLAMQQARDLMKEALCARHEVRLVVVTRDDLRLSSMQQKVGNLLPLRNLTGYEPVIRMLERICSSHRDAPLT